MEIYCKKYIKKIKQLRKNVIALSMEARLN